jgi:hypothetical protein
MWGLSTLNMEPQGGLHTLLIHLACPKGVATAWMSMPTSLRVITRFAIYLANCSALIDSSFQDRREKGDATSILFIAIISYSLILPTQSLEATI